MKSFGPWLHELNEPANADLVALQTFANNQAGWPYWSEDPGPYAAAIANANPASPNPAQLNAALAALYARWKIESDTKTTWKEKLGTALYGNFGKIALLAFGIVFAWFLYSGLTQSASTTLANTELVRGTITYAFVITATGIILLFALSVFWVDKDEIEDRFKSAKDLLTIVIGVLGTIMGFYFGSTTGEKPPIVSMLSPALIRGGADTAVTGTITGGTPPYRYTVKFTDPSKTFNDALLSSMNAESQSPKGDIAFTLKKPEIKQSGSANYTIIVVDSKNATSTLNGTVFLEPPAAAPAPAPAPVK